MASRTATRFTVTFIFCIILFHLHVSATRPLHVLHAAALNENLIIQALPRGPVPPSAGNPCTNIPGRSNGRCTLAEMNAVDGGVVHHHAPPPPFRGSVLKHIKNKISLL
ncbi:Phosphoribosylaminoimidazole carboxylase atpase-subunit isoform 1 [Hibiscus syriacus]|uniref:Phosphoribosylaminoimidazole carboxylase atpase-subunit isoform 1 n=1 Tax=Hibiscus syriacus TaxID=106335 RepID=A0A6A2Y9W6_HIBSY|nr:Phosphoribosylaminoimidazole carboxylase atpase-subunit isoform 1 [Hibiscus syriacus]